MIPTSERGSHFDEDEGEEHEFEVDEVLGEITHEGNKVPLMKNQWKESHDRCKGHTDGTDLVFGLTDYRENEEIDSFHYKRKIYCSQIDCNKRD